MGLYSIFTVLAHFYQCLCYYMVDDRLNLCCNFLQALRKLEDVFEQEMIHEAEELRISGRRRLQPS